MSNVCRLPFLKGYTLVRQTAEESFEKEKRMNVVVDKITRIMWDNNVTMPGIEPNSTTSKAEDGECTDAISISVRNGLISYVKNRFRVRKNATSATDARRKKKANGEVTAVRRKSVKGVTGKTSSSSSSSSQESPSFLKSSASMDQAAKEYTLIAHKSRRVVKSKGDKSMGQTKRKVLGDGDEDNVGMLCT